MIDKSLNYYKAQKLFKDLGVQSGHPSMHMVFTGNPGTAKTTTARLLAAIMKENGLLAQGKLYELGRSDLVGKYVGWTASIVKEKFQKAKGSILFIDEAYSLLDGHTGLYGRRSDQYDCAGDGELPRGYRCHLRRISCRNGTVFCPEIPAFGPASHFTYPLTITPLKSCTDHTVNCRRKGNAAFGRCQRKAAAHF